MPSSSHRRAPLICAFGIALIVEVAVLLGFVVYLPAQSTPLATDHAPMRVSLVTLPPAPKPAPQPVPKPVAPPPKPVPEVKPPPKPAPPPPKPLPKPVPRSHPRPKPQVKPSVVRAPAPVQEAKSVDEVPQPVAPQPVAMPQSAPTDEAASQDRLALFEGQLNQAVKEAMVYPAVARMMQQGGQARVAFTYLDGGVSNIRIVQSSGIPSLDNAAMAAVRNATYPAAPDFLRHRSQNVTLWVIFNLASADTE